MIFLVEEVVFFKILLATLVQLLERLPLVIRLNQIVVNKKIKKNIYEKNIYIYFNN